MSEFSTLIKTLGFTKKEYAVFSGKSLNTIHRRTSNSESFYSAPKEVIYLLKALVEVKIAEESNKSKNS